MLFQRPPSSPPVAASSSSSSSAVTYLIDRVISDVFMQERSNEKEYARDGYTVKWTFANELGLIFVAVYQKILELTWVEEFLVSVKRTFVKLYGDNLRNGDTKIVINDLHGVQSRFRTWFDLKVQVYEGSNRKSAGNTPISWSVVQQELSPPVLATQSDTEPAVTSDDNARVEENVVHTATDSPAIAPAALKAPVLTRLKKGRGRKTKNGSYQSRYWIPPRFFN